MKLFFAGTRGEIEEENKRHKYHSSLIINEKKLSILIDIGIKHSEDLYNKVNQLDAVMITHAHPDHYLWTIKADDHLKALVYLTENTLLYSKYKPKNYKVIFPDKPFFIGHFEITAYDVIHSLRCPAVCYKIKGENSQIIYAPDILDTVSPKELVFKGVDLLVADGSSYNVSLVRKRDGNLFGHAMIKTIINWCKKYYIKNLIITHCGKQIVSGNEEEIYKNILEIADNIVNVIIAYDGMEINYDKTIVL